MGGLFPGEFGDGSNRWIDGTVETVTSPVESVTNPYDTVAGAADAAALNFDEGVGGLTSLIDDQPGNTAGPGQQDWRPVKAAGEAFNDAVGSNPAVQAVVVLVVIVALGQLFDVNLGGGASA